MAQHSKAQMEKKVAYLEFVNDQLTTELRYVDTLLRSIGFPEGLETVKLAARELMDREHDEPEESREI
ncbi:Uncharacterized protein SCG7086_AB_00240 [Chlamydiales bacterium SCGC AG-110-P3]|nr:Uncharacterized protein SCG7086_AB_00240 [Chlamydiales bacterium SCGC AG-110-P3]